MDLELAATNSLLSFSICCWVALRHEITSLVTNIPLILHCHILYTCLTLQKTSQAKFEQATGWS